MHKWSLVGTKLNNKRPLYTYKKTYQRFFGLKEHYSSEIATPNAVKVVVEARKLIEKKRLEKPFEITDVKYLVSLSKLLYNILTIGEE